MARVSSVLTIAVLFIILVFVGNAVGNVQQVPATDSVADAAREQKALDSKQKKPALKKIYTNSDLLEAGADAPKTDTQKTPEAGSLESRARASTSPTSTDQPTGAKNQRNLNSRDERSSVFDRSKQNPPETIVVPAGTKITVDIFEENSPRNLSLRVHSGTVVNIVQVGSTVVIPALSKVTIQDSVGMMELIGVTIDGVRYELQTDRVVLVEGSISEAVFTLTRGFAIKR